MERQKIMSIIQGNIPYISNNLNVPGDLKARAQKLCWEYNQTPPDDEETQRRILHELFGECSDLTL